MKAFTLGLLWVLSCSTLGPVVKFGLGEPKRSGQILIRSLTMYCLMASILFWNSALAAFMLVIMAPMLPTMEAKMRTPTRKSKVTKIYLKWRIDNFLSNRLRVRLILPTLHCGQAEESPLWW